MVRQTIFLTSYYINVFYLRLIETNIVAYLLCQCCVCLYLYLYMHRMCNREASECQISITANRNFIDFLSYAVF